MSNRKQPSSPSSETTEQSVAPNQRPTWLYEPHTFEYTDAQDAAALYEYCTGKVLDPWQVYVIQYWLARVDDKDNTPVFTTCGLAVPRQNGKNECIEAYELYKLVACHENILHTAHLVSTAKKSFERMARIFTAPKCPNDLKAMLVTIRRTNGEQGIYLQDNGVEMCIEYASRSRGGARGATYSVVIFDEAQEFTDEQSEALVPTLSASPTGYRTMVYTGTPPGPTCPGTVFAHLRDSVNGNDPPRATCWHEWSIDKPLPRDTTFDDIEEAVMRTNPAMGIRLDMDFTRNEFAIMSLDGFARERLGWWQAAVSASAAIPARLWRETTIEGIGIAYEHRMALAVKFTPDGSQYVLAGIKQNKRGEYAGEVIEVGTTGEGTKALAQALYERRTTASVVVVDGMNGAPALCDNLADLNAPKNYVIRPSSDAVIAACLGFVDGLQEGTIAHTRQDVLDDSALNAIKRKIGGRGGWGFGSDGVHDSTPLEALVLAHWGLRNTRRNPKRKQKLL